MIETCSLPLGARMKVMRPELSSYTHLASGKVRDIYDVDENTLLMVVSDRISAYDHALEPAIPDKGRVLTATSKFFFDSIDFLNHLAGPLDDERIPAECLGRAMVVKKLDMLPFECVARGFLTGSGLKEYQADGTVCGGERTVADEDRPISRPYWNIRRQRGAVYENYCGAARVVGVHGAIDIDGVAALHVGRGNVEHK